MRVANLMSLKATETIHTEAYVSFITKRIKELEAASEGLYQLINRQGGPFMDDEALLDMVKSYKQELIARKAALLGARS